MRILICGATGFIGRNILEHYLKSGHEVIATYHVTPPFKCDNVHWVKADLRKIEDINSVFKNIDIVIQAAATTSGSKDIVNSPALHVTDNAVMNSLIFRKCSEEDVKHVIFFSCSVMYPSSDSKSKEEDFNPAQITKKYFGVAWTKVYLEKMAEFFSGQGKTKFSVIRHSNIYGPHDKFDLEKGHVFGATMKKIHLAKTKNEKKITIWGEGNEKRDLLHVDDLVSLIDLLISKQDSPFLLLNAGSDTGTSVNEIVNLMLQETKTQLSIEHDIKAPSIPVNIILDSSKAKSMGWKPQIMLQEGIKRTWEWYQNNQGR